MWLSVPRIPTSLETRGNRWANASGVFFIAALVCPFFLGYYPWSSSLARACAVFSAVILLVLTVFSLFKYHTIERKIDTVMRL